MNPLKTLPLSIRFPRRGRPGHKRAVEKAQEDQEGGTDVEKGQEGGTDVNSFPIEG